MPNLIEQTFPEPEIDALVDALHALPPGQRTLKRIQDWASERGLRISKMSAKNFKDRTFEERLAELRAKREMAELIVEAADAGKGITDAGMSMAVKRRFDQLASGESIDDETLSTIMLDLSRARQGDQRAKKLEADLRLRDEQIAKLEADREDRARKAAEAREVLAKGAKAAKAGLTPETLKRIEEAAALL